MKTFQKLKQNPELWQAYWVRERVIDAIREYFKGRGFHEVETPLLLPVPSSEPYLEVFQTELKDDVGHTRPAFLPTSPEYALKKLLAAGSGSIFEITKSFRNGEGKSSRHNPEFTIMEWYEVGGNYMSVLAEMERLIAFIYQKVLQSSSVPVLQYQGKKYSLKTPWEKISVAEAFQKYAGIGAETMLDGQRLKEYGLQHGYQVTAETTWEEIWNQIIANEIEPHLGVRGPTVLYDYPVAQAVLSKKAKDPRFAERWELYLGGLELANCYGELTDAAEVETRFAHDMAERKRLGKTQYGVDDDFVAALKMGMPECSGIAVGIDRLAMLFADVANIDEVRFFPASELYHTPGV